MIGHQVHLNAVGYLSKYGQPDRESITLGDIQVNVRMLRCEDIVILAVRLLDVAKLTIVVQLSLLISCKFSFSIVGLKNVIPAYFGIEISQ
jgi:hypothetical protein